MPNHKPELIELLINEAVNDQQVNNPNNYVEVLNRARPQGFAEHFTLILADTPQAHSTLKQEFFLHFFLGSVLTLPNTSLMSKLNIEDILFKLDRKNYQSVKLVFKIHEQEYYKLKFIIINTSSDSENIGFSREELAEIKGELSGSSSIATTEMDGQILHITRETGFKLKILPELSHKEFTTIPSLNSNIDTTFHKVKKDTRQDFDPLLAQLSNNDISSVHQNIKDTFVLLKKIYTGYPQKALGNSEASYHGYSYGFFRLNYKYKYALDCYVERIAGKGYMDLVLLSRNNDKGDNNQQTDNVANHKHQNSPPKDKKQFIPIIVELKAGTGALKAIEQIHESGYIYNLPNIRTNAQEAVIVGVDFSAEDDLTVQNLKIKAAAPNLISQLAEDVLVNKDTVQKIVEDIHGTIAYLYYASIKSKDHHYLSRVLLGQAFTSRDNSDGNEMQLNKYVFLYNKDGKLNLISDRVTTIVLHQDSKGIILNIIEGSNTPQTRFKSKKQDKIFDDSKILPIENLAIQDLTIINIAVNPKAEIFSGLMGKSYIMLKDIKVEKKNINEFRYHQKYQGQFQSIATVKAQDLINLIYNTDSSVDSDNYVPPNKKQKVLDKDLQKVLLECLSPVKEFVKQESDLQAIIQGMFINQKLLGGKQIKVFSEVSCGPGRVDLALSIIDNAFQEDKPILIELKYGSNNMLLTDAEKQLTAYSQYLKSATTYKEVQHIAMVYNPNSKQNNFLQVKISSKKIDHTSQSSDNAQDSSTINSVNKQVKKVLEISELEFLKSIKTIDDDIFLDLSYDTNRQKLSNEKFEAVIEFLNKVTVLSSSTITLSLASNHINQDHATKLFQLLEQNISINSLDLSNTNLNQELLKRLIETLKKKENLIISEHLSPADKLWILKKFLEDLSIDTSIAQVQHQKARQLLDEIQAIEHLPIGSEERNKQLENIFIKQKNKIRFSSLQRLDLSNNQLGKEAAPILQNALETLDGLEEIHLSNNKIGDAGLKSIAQGLERNYSIKILKLSNIGITKIKELSKILSQKKSIIELDLSSNKLSNAEIAVLLDDLTKANAIKKLNLSDNNIQGNALESLTEFIATSNSLQELNLSKTNLGNEGLELITPALSNSNLKLFLDISHNKISNADILFKSLNPDYQDSVLTGLVLAHNEIKEVIELSDALIDNKKLIYLDLSNNQITFEKASYIFFSLHPVDEDGTAGNDILNTLILSNNPIRIDLQDQENIQDLQMMLSHNDGLTHLALSNIAIDDSVLTKILDSLQENTRLESIDLSYNQIQLINVEAQTRLREFLRENTILVELNLANNQITDQGGKIIISSFLEKEIMNKKITKRTEFIDLNLSGNPSLGNEFINQLIDIIKGEYPIENLRLANNNWSKGHTTKLIDAIVASKERKVNIDLSGNEISKNSQIKFNNYRAAIKLQVLDDDLQNSIIATCLLGTSRGKRSINECKIGWLDVDEISSIKTRKSEDIIIDSQKFLKYSKQYIKDEQKSLQLVRLAEEIKNRGDEKIVGDNQGLFDRVIKAGGYQNYIQQERINDLGSYIINRDSDSISPALKLKLINAVGKVQLIRGLHSTIVSCQDEITSSCALSVSGLGYSFVSQPIENMMVKVAPKIVKNAADVTGKIVPRVLSYDTKFVVKIFGAKYATKIAKGGAGAISGVFDIIDIGMSTNALIECNKRADSDNPCSDKEIRDNIASITFSSVSFISGVVLTVAGAGTMGVVVGAVIMIGQGIYNGISNIIEYEEKYDTTHSENWSIFWRTFLLQRMSEDIEHLEARLETVNKIVENAEQILSNSPEFIVAYATGLGKEEVKHYSQCITHHASAPSEVIPMSTIDCSSYMRYNIQTAYSKIDMSNSAANTNKLSRVLPQDITNTTMICLPKITDADYEKGLAQSKSDAIYECDNAVVMVHNHRKDLSVKKKYIVYDLKYVSAGTIISGYELNNIFQIFAGSTQIFGSSNLNNIFYILDNKYNGKIYLGHNSTNIIDVSNLLNNVISMEYTHIYPLTMNISITANKGTISQVYSTTKDVEIRYSGRKNKVDKIICKQLLHQRDGHIVNDNGINHNNITIDSGGGLNYYQQDEILNCTHVIASPNTVIQGGYNNYTIYIKSLDYAKNDPTRYAASKIDITGSGNIIFPEISLLKNCEITKPGNNSLSIIMPLRNNAQYELILSNNKGHNPNYVLRDKDNNRIDILDYNKLVLYVECKFDTIIKVVNYYRDVLDSMKDYAVFGIVNNTQYNNVLQFGTSENDIINTNKDIVYVEGNNGSDLYIINDNIDYPVRINNKAQDLQLDILKLPVNNILYISLIENNNHLHLLFNNSNEVKGYREVQQEVIINNYFQDNVYKHIALMDKNNNSYIPFKQSEVIELLPFYHASFDRNIFILSSNNKKAVIDIDVDNMALHKQGNNLLLTEKSSYSFNSLNIILRDYNKDQQAWLGTKLYTYNNGDIGSIVDLNNTELSTIRYQDQYDSVIKEYVVDLTAKNHQINYNQQKFNPLLAKEDNQERIGIVIFQNMSVDSLQAKNHTNNLILKNSISNKELIIENWYNNHTEYKISMFEFNTVVEPERIYISHDFIRKIGFNNRLSNEIFKNHKIVSAVISYLILSCDQQDIPVKRLICSFLENEKNRLSNKNLSVEAMIKDINSSNDMSGKALLLLAAKAHNKLLLKYDFLEKEYILQNSCFNTILSSSKIKEMIECINTDTDTNFMRFEQFVDNNKKAIQNIITQLATSHVGLDNHHKHRHHHGEDNRGVHHSDNKHIPGQYRQRRDVENEKKIVSDNNAAIFESQDNVEVISIGSSGSSAKPIGYSVVNWISKNVQYLFNAMAKAIVFNIDDNVIKKEILNIDVSDNQFEQYNCVGELSHIIAFDGVSRPVCEKRQIGNAIHNNKISGYTAFDSNATLMLINIIVRKFTGVKDNYDNKIITNDFNTKYAQNLAYSSYAPNTEENKEHIGLLGTSDI